MTLFDTGISLLGCPYPWAAAVLAHAITGKHPLNRGE